MFVNNPFASAPFDLLLNQEIRPNPLLLRKGPNSSAFVFLSTIITLPQEIEVVKSTLTERAPYLDKTKEPANLNLGGLNCYK